VNWEMRIYVFIFSSSSHFILKISSTGINYPVPYQLQYHTGYRII
jgi:hypothetical protein